MKSIKLRSIKIENFKGAKERTIEFGENTKICGANATGKTTIFDAFTWLLFGKDSLGSAKFDIRPLDKDGKMIDNLEICVEAILSVDEEEYTLKKAQKQKWVKKRGTNTTEFQGNVNEFEINGYPKSEKEFKQFISGMIDEKVFNIVTNPVAFTSLPWKEQREILMQFVGESSDVEIAEEHGEKFSKLIPELKIANTDDILKKYTKAKNALNKEMTEIPARIDEVSKQLVSVDVGALEVEKATKEVALKKVEDELSGGAAKLEEINEKRKAVMDLQFKGSALCQMAESELSSKRTEVRKRIDECERQLDSDKKEIHVLRNQIETATLELNDAKKEKEQLEEKWRTAKYSTFPELEPLAEYVPPTPLSESDLKCPTCGQELPEDVKNQKISEYQKRCEKAKSDYDARVIAHESKYKKDKSEFEQNRSEELKSITKQAKNCENLIEQHQSKITDLEKTVEDLTEDMSVLEEKLNLENSRLDSIPAVADMSENAEYQNIKNRISELENEIEEMSKETVGKTELEAKKAVLRDEISDIEWKIKSADNAKIKERIAELEKEKAEVGQKIAEQEQMIDLTEEFIRTKMNRISSIINEKFNVVSFMLFENQINGGLKECCECTVNGVPYSSLNNGHRIIAGLDIISSLSKLNGVDCPIFLDNAESISKDNFPDVQSQLICMYVTNDKELKAEA
jgi:DNA repair exonuclease SbcCD ATPase subunit